MSEELPTGVVDPSVVKETVAVEPVKALPEAPKASPAQDLRDIQALVVNGIFPGNMAPAVMKAYQLLDKMASQIEKGAE